MNEYKGIKGGDPRMRPVYRMVKVSFVCPECNLPKRKEVRSDKADRGIKGSCQDCMNRANLEKSQRLERESAERYRAHKAEQFRRPLRTLEEKEALLAQYADAPKHDCDDCGRNFLIEDASYPFANDNFHRENAILMVDFGPDPFQEEINGDDTPLWLCASCYNASAMEI
jgi:hypothetical protein